eukprot:5135308-Prymnesium_polylepis.2
MAQHWELDEQIEEVRSQQPQQFTVRFGDHSRAGWRALKEAHFAKHVIFIQSSDNLLVDDDVDHSLGNDVQRRGTRSNAEHRVSRDVN